MRSGACAAAAVAMSHCYPCVVPHSCPWIASTTAGHRRCIVAPVGALNGKQIGGGGFHKPTRNCSWKKTAVVNCAAAEAPPEALSNYPESQHEILELDIGGKKVSCVGKGRGRWLCAEFWMLVI